MNSSFTGNVCKVPIVNFYSGGSDVIFKNVIIRDNKKDPNSNFDNSDRIFAVANNLVKLENCVIQNNEGYKYLGVGMAQINKSQIEGVSIP